MKPNDLIDIAKLGKEHPEKTLNDTIIKWDTGVKIDEDELKTRYLLISAVLDQGPDMSGLRFFYDHVLNEFYSHGKFILHDPSVFFKYIGFSVDTIIDQHKIATDNFADEWANRNDSTPGKYNLFMENSRQALHYAVSRWGVPLSLIILLENENRSLMDYIESYTSAELFSIDLKSDNKYGLGKTIGNKASHLFTRWYVSAFDLCRIKNDKGWQGISYELPLDSNAGRVLFRIGWLDNFVDIPTLKIWNVIQPGSGKHNKNYIRVTNLSNNKIDLNNSHISNKFQFLSTYYDIAINYLKLYKRNPAKVSIQHIPNVILKGTDYSISDLDDGLMYIGTKFCFNTDQPDCDKCPIREKCFSNNIDKKYIEEYAT